MSQYFGVIPIKPSSLVGDEAFNAIIGDYLRALEALGNHLVLAFGHHLDRLHNWCKGAACHIATL